jgi:chemotaxis protein MotB
VKHFAPQGVAMPRFLHVMARAGVLFGAWPVLAGCNQNPYWGVQRTGYPAPPVYAAQVQDLNQRTSALDADNRDLHAELARSQRQVRVLQDEVGLLRDQLQEKATDLRELLLAKEEADRRAESMEAATRHRGGATITANTSLRQSLPEADLPGLEVHRENDAIHIELSADRLFQQNSDQLLPTAQRWIDLVGDVIRESYPRQLIGIEGHIDGMPAGAASSHQLTSAQAIAVFNVLTRVKRLPERQFFAVGHGANRPRVSNATAAGKVRNRRVEVVIYPETYDDVL